MPITNAVTFTCVVTGNVSPIARVDFYDMTHNVIIGTDSTAPFATTWTAPATGTYYFRASAYDANDVRVNSAVLTLTFVGGGGPPPPTVTSYTVNVTGGTANGVSNGTFTAGTTITVAAGAPPAGQSFKQWQGNAPLANSLAPTTTFTMPSSNVSLTAVFFTPPPLPSLAAGHPRLWLRPADVTRLRTWAVAGNPVYAGLRQMLSRANYGYQICFPNGQRAEPYPDRGDIDGYSGATITVNNELVSEQHALTLAFFALIDPDATARLSHARKAHDLIMVVFNEAAKGHAKGLPFRDPIFALFNRANSTGESWPLVVDWLQGVTDAGGQPVPVFTAAEKATIRSVFLMWANDCLNAYICGGDHPAPIGVTNSAMLLPGGNAHRVAANNYYLGHARLMTLMSLTLDATDDPPLDAAAPAAAPGNTLRSYIHNANGAWLYQQYAMFGDPEAVRTAYGLPATAKVGLASGGIPVEGALYGHSLNYLQGQLLGLQTAGVTDPAVAGPQIALLSAPFWDRFVKGFASSLVPAPHVPPSQPYLGSVYLVAGFGDILRSWATPDMMPALALLALNEQARGLTTHLNEARWFALHAVEGGAADLIRRVNNPYGTAESILYFMLFDPTDPTASAPADPRPGYATTFFDSPNGRLLARDDWSAQSRLFAFRSGWLTINHQNCDGGQLELYRKGEWLTKELSNYDNFGNGQASQWHNTLTLQNWCAAGTPHLNWFEQNYWAIGSQWNNGLSAGDPATIASRGADYAFVESLLTPLYNRPVVFTPQDNATDITHASRSALWLGDAVVVYDRATSVHAGLFKRFNLNFATVPGIDPAAHTATATTPTGRTFAVKTLLPLAATLSYVPEAGTLTNIAQLESMTGRLVVESSDPTKPADMRFLHVLQGADSTVALAPTALVQSTGGTVFEGGVVGDALALFPKNLGVAFAGTSYATSASVKRHFVSGLAAGGSYAVAASSDGVTTTVTISAGGGYVADTAGVLRFVLP